MCNTVENGDRTYCLAFGAGLGGSVSAVNGERSLSVPDLARRKVRFLGSEEYVCMAPHPRLQWNIGGFCSGLEFIDHYWTTKVRSEVFPLDTIP